MPRFLPAMAAACCVFAIAANSQSPKNESASAATPARPEARGAGAVPSKLGPPASGASVGRQPALERPCPPDKEIRTSDLCAQWKAADSSASAARAAWWIGGLGLIIGTLTLLSAIAAALYARAAAKASEASVRDSRIHYQPKLELSSSFQVKGSAWPNEVGIPDLMVKVQNVGNTEAVDVHVTDATLSLSDGRYDRYPVRVTAGFHVTNIGKGAAAGFNLGDEFFNFKPEEVDNATLEGLLIQLAAVIKFKSLFDDQEMSTAAKWEGRLVATRDDVGKPQTVLAKMKRVPHFTA